MGGTERMMTLKQLAEAYPELMSMNVKLYERGSIAPWAGRDVPKDSVCMVLQPEPAVGPTGASKESNKN